MSKLKELKAATSLRGIAALLLVKPGMLSHQLYKKPKNSLYKNFKIPKRHGGNREISAPENDLKLLQHRLSKILQTCQAEISALHGHLEDENHLGIAHGFKRFHTIMTNGRMHVGKRYVFNVDLHDFFGSINFGRVRGFFIKDRNFLLSEDAATVLAQIACYDNRLPQGSPCSPVLSNLIAHSMDIPLARLAAGTGATYSRYADDLTFSTNKAMFPSRIAVQTDAHHWQPGNGLKRIVARSGFAFNESKTRMQYRDSRQEVTGLTVNHKVNVPSLYRNTVRAMVDRLLTVGSFQFIYKSFDRDGSELVVEKQGENRQLFGMLSYIDQVDRFNKKLREKNGLPAISTEGRISLFRKFIYFDNFYSLDEPLIVCEGKTDNVYLRCAIKQLASSYPALIHASKLKVKFFKYSDRRTAEISELSGGVGGICKLLKHYHEYIQNWFRAPWPEHPVIVFIDNDQGADSVYSAISGITKRPKPAGRSDFIHVTGNLYIVPTPFGPQYAKTAVEDFFDSQTLGWKLDGKSFRRSKDKDQDSSTEYGKAAFARDVVAKNMESIDFRRFHPILDRFVKVVDDYRSKRSIAITTLMPPPGRPAQRTEK